MDRRNWLEVQINSVVIVHFMIEFDKFERLAKSIFQREIQRVDHKYKSILYFYYGCTVGNEWRIDYNERCIERNGRRIYNDEEMFKAWPLDKINKFLRKERIIQYFDYEIGSIQTPMSTYPFYDSCEKLIKMRNCLAHSITSVDFKDAEIIESLSDNKIKERIYDWLDSSVSIEDMSDMAKAICSNTIYMNILAEKLHEVSGKR